MLNVKSDRINIKLAFFVRGKRMKKFVAVMLSLLIFTGSTKAMAIDNVSPKGFPNSMANIVVFIRFNDEDEFLTEENSRMIESTYNEFIDANNDNMADEGSISLKSYINDLTYGNTRVDTNFYPYDEGNNKYYSLKAPEDRGYYLDKPIGGKEEKNLISWAFNSIKDEINLSGEELDRNSDGKIDNITFVFNGAAYDNDNMIWPHKTVFNGTEEIKGKKLYTYNIINSINGGGNIFNKGILNIITHEFLHSYRFPDLYRLYGNGNPVGVWDIMDESISFGQMPLVYTRQNYGSVGINIGEIKESGHYELKKSNTPNIGDRIAYIIKSPLSDKEYFMLEYRKAEGNWDSSLPGSGILVYRINQKVNEFKGNIYGSPDHIYIFRPGDIDSSSAAGYINSAFLSKDESRDKIGTSNLSSGFDSNAIYFNDGSNSGIEIYNIGNSSGDTISFDVNLPNLNEQASKERSYKENSSKDLKSEEEHSDKQYVLTNDNENKETYDKANNNELTTVDKKEDISDSKEIRQRGITLNKISDDINVLPKTGGTNTRGIFLGCILLVSIGIIFLSTKKKDNK
jgi:M6 family metalloprotease-like protein/LPXTG-motif cell wall-anchored protein